MFRALIPKPEYSLWEAMFDGEPAGRNHRMDRYDDSNMVNHDERPRSHQSRASSVYTYTVEQEPPLAVVTAVTPVSLSPHAHTPQRPLGASRLNHSSRRGNSSLMLGDISRGASSASNRSRPASGLPGLVSNPDLYGRRVEGSRNNYWRYVKNRGLEEEGVGECTICLSPLLMNHHWSASSRQNGSFHIEDKNAVKGDPSNGEGYSASMYKGVRYLHWAAPTAPACPSPSAIVVPVSADVAESAETSSSDARNRLVVVSCGHYFHEACIHEWLGQRDTCPVCRASLQPFS